MKPLRVLSCLLILLAVQGVFAAMPEAPARPTSSAAALAHFMPEPAPLDLRGAHARAELFVPIAAGLDLQRLTLHLAATNSVALRPKRSVLRVLLDDTLVAQIPLDPSLPRIEATIELPVGRLHPGYHRLVFDAAQHYTADCEDPSAPELWTQIDTRRSWLALQARRQEGPVHLAELDRLFDPRLWGPQQLTIAHIGPVTPELARLGSLAAQAAALRLRYRPLQVAQRSLPLEPQALAALMQGPADNGPVLLFATAREVATLLGEKAAAAQGAVLRLEHRPAWPERPLLIVQGGSIGEMERALQALIAQQAPLPDRAQADIRGAQPAPVLVSLPAGRPLHLRELGWRDDWQVSGRYGQRAIDFTLPADFYTPRVDFLVLRLNLAHGAGLRADSALNVFVNGAFAQAVALNDARGGRYDDYEVRIPVSLLQPGPNRVELKARLVPAVTGRCLEQAIDHLQLTVRADSSLRLPEFAPVAAVPDLRLLGRSAYPYAEARSLGLWLGDSDPRTVGAAWTLLARLAQVHGRVLPQVEVGMGAHKPSGAEDLILVGQPAQFPADGLKDAPVRPDGRILHAGSGLTGESPAWWRRWLVWLSRGLPPAEARPTTASVTVQGPALGRQAALMQWLDAEGRLHTWFAAESGEVLQERIGQLIEPAVWTRLEGDLVVWRGEDHVYTQRVGETALRGGAPWSMRLSFLFSQWPVYWLSIGLVVLLLAWTTWRLLLRFKARRHGEVEEEGR
jgi:hypothetical protein